MKTESSQKIFKDEEEKEILSNIFAEFINIRMILSAFESSEEIQSLLSKLGHKCGHSSHDTTEGVILSFTSCLL